MSNGKKGASVNPRLRLSAWVDPTIFMNGRRKDITRPDGTVIPNVFIPDVSRGIDSLFKDDALVDRAVVDGKTVIDDISLLRTFRDDNTANLTLDWDSGILGKDHALQKQFYARVIDHCHRKLGTQCLVGITRTELGPVKGVAPMLARWFKSADKAKDKFPDIDTMANQWVKFVEDNLPAYDGISFDLEGVVGQDKELAVTTANASDFYRGFATRLTKAGVQKRGSTGVLAYDHIVAFASGNLIGEVDGPPMKSSRVLKHATKKDAAASNGKIKEGELLRDATGNFISAHPPLKAAFWEKAQDFSLGKGLPNLIIRTMSYDNFRRNDSQQLLDDWHADLVRFFLTMPDVTFQLGIKTIDGPGQLKRGMDGVIGGVAVSDTVRIAALKKRCTNLLNPNKIGLCLFPQSVQFWKDANETLNANVREAGKTVGMPLQSPLDKVAVGALVKK
jgi:hypothetical protein